MLSFATVTSVAYIIKDTGLGVRKRVVRLLKTVYSTTEDIPKKIDICSKIILRMLDEDDTVKVGAEACLLSR